MCRMYAQAIYLTIQLRMLIIKLVIDCAGIAESVQQLLQIARLQKCCSAFSFVHMCCINCFSVTVNVRNHSIIYKWLQNSKIKCHISCLLRSN